MTTRPRRTKQGAKEQLGDLVSQHESQEFPYRAGDIHRFRVCTAADHQGNVKNCVSNPHCLYGLGERKEGIWNVKQPMLKGLGDDPEARIRGFKARRAAAKEDGGAGGSSKRKRLHRVADDDYEDDGKWKEVPTGLTNLGNTCYLSALLQLMFFNRRLRDAVYRFRPPETQQNAPMAEIMKELQNVFGHMQCCKEKAFTVDRFVKLLGLDPSVQQDPQEFNRLFMQKIEDCSGNLSNNSLGSVVKELFRGAQKWVTECRNCTYQSGREQTFDEIELSLEGHDSVKSCLKRYLLPEYLVGDNKYFCSDCKSKQEASRRIVLTNLPPVLNIHLIRYVFDMQTGQKKKVKDLIFLDETINFSDIRGKPEGAMEDDEDEIYELMAVLFHKGSRADQGHYTAEIKDVETGKWWFFDDTEVKPAKTPSQATSKQTQQDKGKQQQQKAAAAPPSSSSKPEAVEQEVVVLVDDSDEEGDDTSVQMETTTTMGGGAAASTGSAAAATAGAGEADTGATKRKREAGESTTTTNTAAAGGGGKGSADAYVLVYVRKGYAFPKEEDLRPPPEVLAKTQEWNAELDGKIIEYRKGKAELESQIIERRAAYERLFASENPPIAPNDHYVWVPRHWLRCWITGLHLPKEDPVAATSGRGKKDSSSVTGEQQESGSGGGGGSSSSVIVDVDGGAAVEVVDMTGDDDGSSDEKTIEPVCPPQSSVFCERILMSEYRCKCSTAKEKSWYWRLDPEKTSELKVVRLEVLEAFQDEIREKYPETEEQYDAASFRGESLGGGQGRPPYYCEKCVESLQRKQQSRAEKSHQTDALMKALCEPEPVNGTYVGKVFLLARKWEQMFKKDYERKRKGMRDGQATLDQLWASPGKAGGSDGGGDETIEGDDEYATPNLSITCQHDRLVGTGRQYRPVTESCWKKVQDLFKGAKPYTTESEPCHECKAEQQKESEERKAKKEARGHELRTKELKAVAKRKVPFPPVFKQDVEDPVEKRDMHFMLVRSDWLDTWRIYHNDLSQPKPQAPANETLLCEHGNLILPRFIAEVCDKGELPKMSESEWQEAAEKEVVGGDLLTVEEWRQLMEFYPPAQPGEFRDIDVTFHKLSVGHTFKIHVETKPDACVACMESRTKDQERKQSEYTDKPMKLIMLGPGQEPPPPVSTQLSASGRSRRPTRGAKSRSGGTHTILGVDSKDTVGTFKLKAWQIIHFEEFGKTITLYHDGKPLTDNRLTLADYNVRADTTLYGKLVDAPDGHGVFEECDFPVDHEGPNGGGVYRPEQGFQGTFLAASHSPFKREEERKQEDEVVMEEEESMVVEEPPSSSSAAAAGGRKRGGGAAAATTAKRTSSPTRTSRSSEAAAAAAAAAAAVMSTPSSSSSSSAQGGCITRNGGGGGGGGGQRNGAAGMATPESRESTAISLVASHYNEEDD